jgi:hypothetical protein
MTDLEQLLTNTSRNAQAMSAYQRLMYCAFEREIAIIMQKVEKVDEEEEKLLASLLRRDRYGKSQRS